jgi:hypothetical protein
VCPPPPKPSARARPFPRLFFPRSALPPPRRDPLLPSWPRRSACRRDHLVGLGCGEMSTTGARRNNTSTSTSIGAATTTPGQQTLGRGVGGAAAAAGLKRGGQSTAPPPPSSSSRRVTTVGPLSWTRWQASSAIHHQWRWLLIPSFTVGCTPHLHSFV